MSRLTAAGPDQDEEQQGKSKGTALAEACCFLFQCLGQVPLASPALVSSPAKWAQGPFHGEGG